MRKFSISDIAGKPSILSNQDLMPFQITHRNRVVADVIPPGTRWPTCENCKQVTQNVFRFKDKKLKRWRSLTLCEKCKEELF